ncbi:MAG: zinc ribbon domain-containing protein [Gemmataceae bacterium]|nr:zinc ribbon domain-containing protein [Gemmataceae bacterium]
MPLFRYHCEACDHTFEELTSGRTADAVRCPACDAGRVERQLALPAIGRAIPAATNCRGDGPPCGASGCGRGV